MYMKNNKTKLFLLTALLMLVVSSCGESSLSSDNSISSSTYVSETTTAIVSTSDEQSSVESTEDSAAESLNESSAEPSTSESSAEIPSASTAPLVETLVRTIDFEELDAGNMSATHHNTYYDGLIVADGRVTTTKKTSIDNKSLGMRMPASTTEEPRICTIKVSGYTKIVLDLKQERTHTRIKTNTGAIYQGTKNEDILRDVEILTTELTELVFTFYTETLISSTMDCGFDNIRFYALVEEGGLPPSSETPTSSEPISSSEETSTTSEIPTSVDGTYDYITMRDIAEFLQTKDAHYPISDAFIKEYQQKTGGYIDYARQLGKVVDKSICEPDQKWHFFDSWLYRTLEEGGITWTDSAKNRVYTKLLCPELLLWIYEACAAPETKILAAYDAAVAGKEAGTHISTIAKNMRACVPWEDLEINIQYFLDNK